MSKTKLIVALDFDSLDEVGLLVTALGDRVAYYKVGKQLFTRCGPPVLAWLKGRGKQVFLDLKFHDIPNTVAKAVRAAAELGADMINVHASGGAEMISAAVSAARETRPEVLLIAVTVLTSLDAAALAALGVNATPEEQVARLAKLAQDAGAHGVVASARESEVIRRVCGPDFVQVLPGIRPAGAAAQDQKRVVTPAAAAALGAHYIVVGRPITQAPDPQAAADSIIAALEGHTPGGRGRTECDPPIKRA